MTLRSGVVLSRMTLCVVGLVSTLGFVAVSSSPAGATTHHSSSHHGKTKPKSKSKSKKKPTVAKSTAGTKASFCNLIDNSAASTKLQGAIEADLEAGNFSAAKQLFVTVADDMQKLGASGDPALQGAPSNVVAAIKTIETAVPALNTGLANATNFTQLTAAFEAFGTAPGVAAAEKTLGAYSAANCGT